MANYARVPTYSTGQTSPIVPRTLAERVARLTPMQKRVYRAALSGSKHNAIAKKVGIAPTQVKFHLGEVYKAVGVSSKLELLIFTYYHPELIPNISNEKKQEETCS